MSVILQRSVFKYRRRAARARVRAGAPRLPARAAAPSLRDEGVERVAGRGALLDHRHPLRVPRAEHAQAAMIPAAWRAGEVAVVGLGQSGGRGASCSRATGVRVYASDAGGVRRSSSATAARAARARRGRRDWAATISSGSRARRSSSRAPACRPTRRRSPRARAAGVPIVSEIEVGLRALAAHALHRRSPAPTARPRPRRSSATCCARSATTPWTPGNIGTPRRRDRARARAPPAWIALEMSSFQLHDTPSIAPDVGVLTNLAPDHLDRYASVDGVLRRQGAALPERRAGVAVGDERRRPRACMEMIARVPGARHSSAVASLLALPTVRGATRATIAPAGHAAWCCGAAAHRARRPLICSATTTWRTRWRRRSR